MISRRIKIQDDDEGEKEVLQKDESDCEEEEEEEQVEIEDSQESEDEDSPIFHTKYPSIRIQKNHPETQIIGDKDAGVSTRIKSIE